MMRWGNRIVLLTIGAASLFLTACSGEDSPEQVSCGPTRTVLVWLGGDNNLADETSRKIEAMRRGWSGAASECLIYEDTPAGARLLRLHGGCAPASVPFVETLREYGRENSASAEVFARVLHEVARDYPADSYGLLYFSHASGWFPVGALEDPVRAGDIGTSAESVREFRPSVRSLGWDSSTTEQVPDGMTHAEMELSDFAAAIPDGRFDFILFEACLTAGVETAYALRRKADWLLVSSAEIVSPGFTPIYTEAFRYLFDPSLEADEALQAFGRTYIDHVNTLAGDARSATLSLIRTSGLDSLAARVAESLPLFSESTADMITRLQHFDRPGSYGESPALPRCFDLGQWIGEVSCTGSHAIFEKQMDRTVAWRANTERFLPSENGFAIKHHSGLTTYIPQKAFPRLNDAWRKTAWYKALLDRSTAPQNETAYDK